MDAGAIERIPITELIPHRSPIVCVDRLLKADEHEFVSTFIIPSDFIFLKHDQVDAAGLLENVAQTAAAGSRIQSRQSEPRAVFIASFKKVEVFGAVKSNDRIVTTVCPIHKSIGSVVYRAEVAHNQSTIISCQLMVVIDP